MDFPYQVVALFAQAPKDGDFVYGGVNGWYPQLAIKRRFTVGESEQSTLLKIKQIADSTKPFKVHFNKAVKPEGMPVEIIDVAPNGALEALHEALFAGLGQSKYPHREGANYRPHMTISWKGSRVVDPTAFENTDQLIDTIYALKDEADDSRILESFKLRG